MWARISGHQPELSEQITVIRNLVVARLPANPLEDFSEDLLLVILVSNFYGHFQTIRNCLTQKLRVKKLPAVAHHKAWNILPVIFLKNTPEILWALNKTILLVKILDGNSLVKIKLTVLIVLLEFLAISNFAGSGRSKYELWLCFYRYY